MQILISILLNGLAVMLTAHLLPGVAIDSYLDAILVAIVLAIINTFVRPILTVLTFPITIFTLGLFLFIINGLMVLFADLLLQGFAVGGLLWAILFSIVLSLINLLLNSIVSK